MNPICKTIHFIWKKEAFLGPLIAQVITGLLIFLPLGMMYLD